MFFDSEKMVLGPYKKLFLFILHVGSATWLYTLELYPTSIRSIGTHMCSVVARVGAIGASYIGILVSCFTSFGSFW